MSAPEYCILMSQSSGYQCVSDLINCKSLRYDKKFATLAGWGDLSYQEGPNHRDSHPHEVDVTVARTDTCPDSITAPMKICLGQHPYEHSRKGACVVRPEHMQQNMKGSICKIFF